MIIKVLGAIDLVIAAILFTYIKFSIISAGIIIIIGIYLIAKSLVFIWSKDIASMVEIIFGIILVLTASITIAQPIIVIMIIYFVLKGIFSMLS